VTEKDLIGKYHPLKGMTKEVQTQLIEVFLFLYSSKLFIQFFL